MNEINNRIDARVQPPKSIDDYVPIETQSPTLIGYIFLLLFIFIVLLVLVLLKH